MDIAKQFSLKDTADIPSILALESEQKPNWLISNYSDLTWKVTDTGDKPDCTVHFNVHLPDGSKLPQHPHLLETIKRVTYGVRTGPLMAVESGSVQRDVAGNLINLVRWMILQDIQNFSDLTRGDLEAFYREVVFGWNVALKTEERLITLLQRYYKIADFKEDDSLELRNEKASAHFPVRKSGNSDQLLLSRENLLDEIGVGRSALRSKGSERIIRLLDEADETCGMYLDPKAKLRLSEPLPDNDDEAVTWIHLARVLDSFNYLNKHKRYLDDALTFHPFAGTSASKKAQAIGAKVSRTRSIPIKQGITMIERSIRWVIDYSPDLLRLSDSVSNIYGSSSKETRSIRSRKLLDTFKPEVEGPGSPWPIRAVTSSSMPDEWLLLNGEQNITLRQAMIFLQTACAVVIAAFSARRAAEITGLKADCIPESDGQHWLKIFIHKTLQADDFVPVPEVVKKAVEVLEQISARARVQNNDDRLFQFASEYSNWNADTATKTLSRNLEAFGLYLDIPTWKGERWLFKAHQFRRFFAILYVHVYELGDFGALSYHLRHFNPEMTQRYVKDDELGQILSYAKKEHTTSIIQNAVLGNVQVNGALGQRLVEAGKKLYERMAQRIQVVSEERFMQRIERMVERQNLELHATPWGYCASKKAEGAPCLASEKHDPDAEMNYSKACARSCRNCSLNARTAEFLPLWKESLSQHVAIIESPHTPPILKAASQRCVTDINSLLNESGYTE